MNAETLCSDCPPVGYPTDKTRCSPCPRRPDRQTLVTDAMVDAAMGAWFEQPTREDDMSLERSIRACLEAALSNEAQP